MKKLPKIFQNEISNITNNKKIYDSLKEIEETKVEKNEDKNKTLTVKEKLKELINSTNYIFNMKITLVFPTYKKECQIAGVVNNHIITMDNEIIKIDELKDIKY